MLSLTFYHDYKEKKYIIDCSNICWIGVNKPKLRNLALVFRKLLRLGIKDNQIIIICDASLRHTIDKPEAFQSLANRGVISEAPAGVRADEFILNFYLAHDDSLIISNDRFIDYKDEMPSQKWMLNRRITVMILQDYVSLIPLAENY